MENKACAHCGGCDHLEICDHCGCCKNCGKQVMTKWNWWVPNTAAGSWWINPQITWSIPNTTWTIASGDAGMTGGTGS